MVHLVPGLVCSYLFNVPVQFSMSWYKVTKILRKVGGSILPDGILDIIVLCSLCLKILVPEKVCGSMGGGGGGLGVSLGGRSTEYRSDGEMWIEPNSKPQNMSKPESQKVNAWQNNVTKNIQFLFWNRI